MLKKDKWKEITELSYSSIYLHRARHRPLGEKKIKHMAETKREKYNVGIDIIPFEDWLLLILDTQMVASKIVT